MHRNRYGIFALLAFAALIVTQAAQACPRCRVSFGELADEALNKDSKQGSKDPVQAILDHDLNNPQDHTATQPSTDQASLNSQFSIALGVDAPTAYFYRGYLQQDRGAIAQPYISISDVIGDENNFSIQPYAIWWNSIHEEPIDLPRGGHGRDLHVARTITRQSKVLVPGDPSNPNPHYETVSSEVFVPANTGSGEGWYESELSGGALITFRDLWIDLSYQIHFFPSDTHDAVQELDAKFSYDLAGIWDHHDPLNRKFSLRPYALVARELQDQNGDENTYIELGAEPTWRFRWLRHNFAVTTPLLVGLSPDGIYYDPNTNDNEFLGYASEGIKASMALPSPKELGHWYLNASLIDLQLFADSAVHENRGSHNELIGMLGIAVMF